LHLKWDSEKMEIWYNEELRNLYYLSNIIEVRKSRIRWVVHATRMGEV
jgi:hypothetical protein